MSNYESKLGVGFLKKRSPSPAKRQTAQNFLDEAIMLYGRVVLEALASAQDGRGKLHQIVQDKDIPIGDALQLIEHLEQLGHIEILQHDKRSIDVLIVPRANYTEASERSVTRAASGSTQKLNSALGVRFPCPSGSAATAPPMITRPAMARGCVRLGASTP